MGAWGPHGERAGGSLQIPSRFSGPPLRADPAPPVLNSWGRPVIRCDGMGALPRLPFHFSKHLLCASMSALVPRHLHSPG